VGGPVIYGISHLVFLLGVYMVGERYAKSSWDWSKRLFSRMTHKNRQGNLPNAGITDRLSDKKE
jgi:hypothetical protein